MTTPAKNSAKKPTSRRSSSFLYTDPDLRDRLKAQILAGDKGGKSGQWSARKAQMLAAEYKKAGGGYLARKTQAQIDLENWTQEDWRTADGKPAIRDGETARYLPAQAWEELTPSERKATDAKKRAGSRAGQQFVANTEPAKAARRRASVKKKAD